MNPKSIIVYTPKNIELKILKSLESMNEQKKVLIQEE